MARSGASGHERAQRAAGVAHPRGAERAAVALDPLVLQQAARVWPQLGILWRGSRRNGGLVVAEL